MGSMLLILLSLLMFTASNASAADILQVDLTSDQTQLSVRDYQQMKLTMRYNCSSTTSNATNAVMTMVLDSNLDMVSLIGSIHTVSTNYDTATRKATFTFKNPLPAGSTGEVIIQARFKISTAAGVVAKNSATFTASNSSSKTSNTVNVTAINPVTNGGGGGTVSFTKGMKIVKTAESDYVNAQAGWVYWDIRHGNTGSAGQNIASYVIEDTFPPGNKLDQIHTDRWAGTNNAVTIFYKTNKNSSYRQWGTSARYKTGDGQQAVYPGELGLPATEWVTALKFSYGTLIGGGSFHPDNMSNVLKIITRVVDPAATTVASGKIVQNCATLTGTGATTQNSCDTVTVSPPSANFGFWHWVSTNTAPYEMGESVTFTASVGVNAESNSDMTNPSVGVLLPKEFEYIGNPTISGWAFDLGGKPAPFFEKVDNFQGTGRTMVRWLWGAKWNNGWKIKAERDWKYFDITFTAKVRQWTPNGYYVSNAAASWAPEGQGYGWFEKDAEDWNGNANVTEMRARHDSGISVETAGGSAGFESSMLVKGELDTAWTQYPNKGITVPAGKADYQIKLKNPSGVIMKNLVLIDILPAIGDKGVIDLSARGSAWSPYLASAVTATGATVSYSLSKNPCRNELTPGIPAGCETPNWTVTPPSDITQVKSLKIDFGATQIMPGDELTISWPMRAPLNAPTKGEVAWNSFGYIASRVDTGAKLLASEPVKTGIAIKPPEPPYYGDFVWNDLNQNGIQDSGEPGINGVRVELYKDNGDKKNDPTADTLIDFTTTSNDGTRNGAYLFSNIGAGDFYAVVIPPSDWGITLSNQGSNKQLDSDGEAIIYKGSRAAVMPVTTLDPLEEDRSWDVGLSDRSGSPSVWAMTSLPDGRVVLGGRFQSSHGVSRKNIVRVNKDGTVDTTFNPGTGFDGEVRSLALRSDGKIVAGGNFKTYNGKPAFGIAVINVDGSHALTPAAPDVNNVRWVGSAPEGMYLAGSFSSIAGVPCRGIARLKLDGTLDTSFVSSNGANGTVNGAAVQADGKLVIGGAFTTYGGVARNRVARLNSNGTIDATFDPLAGANGEVCAIKMIEDGRMILTGSFNSFNGVKTNGTARLLTTGKADPTLNPSALTVDSIQATN